MVADGDGSVVSPVWFVEPAGVVPLPDPPEALDGAWGAAEACVALCMLCGARVRCLRRVPGRRRRR